MCNFRCLGFLREQQEGLPVAVERQTVAQFLKRWLKDVAKPSVRPKTLRSYEQMVRVHLIPSLGRHQLRSSPRSTSRG